MVGHYLTTICIFAATTSHALFRKATFILATYSDCAKRELDAAVTPNTTDAIRLPDLDNYDTYDLLMDF